jgi:hypothetical protein
MFPRGSSLTRKWEKTRREVDCRVSSDLLSPGRPWTSETIAASAARKESIKAIRPFDEGKRKDCQLGSDRSHSMGNLILMKGRSHRQSDLLNSRPLFYLGTASKDRSLLMSISDIITTTIPTPALA